MNKMIITTLVLLGSALATGVYFTTDVESLKMAPAFLDHLARQGGTLITTWPDSWRALIATFTGHGLPENTVRILYAMALVALSGSLVALRWHAETAQHAKARLSGHSRSTGKVPGSPHVNLYN